MYDNDPEVESADAGIFAARITDKIAIAFFINIILRVNDLYTSYYTINGEQIQYKQSKFYERFYRLLFTATAPPCLLSKTETGAETSAIFGSTAAEAFPETSG